MTVVRYLAKKEEETRDQCEVTMGRTLEILRAFPEHKACLFTFPELCGKVINKKIFKLSWLMVSKSNSCLEE